MSSPGKHTFLINTYLLGGGAFIAMFLKYFVYPGVSKSTLFTLDIIALLFILLVILLADSYYRKNKASYSELVSRLNKASADWENERKHLEKQIAQLEEKENAATRFASYQEKVLAKLFQGKKKNIEPHHLLHLLGEIFKANAMILYQLDEQQGLYIPRQGYALPGDFEAAPFSPGEGINGQAALNGYPMVVREIPAGYFPVSSGLGSSQGSYIYLLPVMVNNQCKYLLEMVTFTDNGADQLWVTISEKLVQKGIL